MRKSVYYKVESYYFELHNALITILSPNFVKVIIEMFFFLPFQWCMLVNI